MDKDVELQKIQSLEGYFNRKLNTGYTIYISFIVGTLILFTQLYYQGIFNIIPQSIGLTLSTLGNIGIFAVVLILSAYFLKRKMLDPVEYDNDACFEIIENLINTVEKGEALPSLSELKKMVKKDNKRLKRNNNSSEVELGSNIDRELQIKIAQLNAKLRINLAAVFGFIALAGAFILAGYQLALGAIRTEPINSFEVYISVLFFGFAGIVTVAAISYWLKLRECAKEFDNLK